MKKSILSMMLALLITVFSYGCNEEKDIVDTAVSAKNFNTLVAAVKAADLADTLKSKGPFTVFAPTDAAFAKLPKGTVESLLKPENKAELVKILTYHVVPGKVTADKVVKINSAKTVQGSSVAIKVIEGKVKIDNANVINTDILCTNGVIHVIDSVIMPKSKTESTTKQSPVKDIVDTAVSVKSFTTLVTAVKVAGLVDTLKGNGPFTVFAPTDAAFSKLPKGTVESLLKPENKDQLIKILTYHVVPGKVTANQVVKLNSAKTVQGTNVTINVKEGGVMVNKATVVKTDIHCTNGVIHVIDSVLIPAEEKVSASY